MGGVKASVLDSEQSFLYEVGVLGGGGGGGVGQDRGSACFFPCSVFNKLHGAAAS